MPTQTRSAIINFQDVSLSFDKRRILHNISMKVLPGQTVVIVGASGSGKTTILRLILGLIHPDSGRIQIEGQEIVGLTEEQMTGIRATMALVFQGAALFDSLIWLTRCASTPISMSRKFARESVLSLKSLGSWKPLTNCRPNSRAECKNAWA